MAFNQVPDSDNRIHADDVARQYGFEGALVPGVTVSAYTLHPGVAAWGRRFVERGCARVVVERPLYDRRGFTVSVETARPDSYDAHLVDDAGTRCATARVWLPDGEATDPPSRRADPLADGSRVPATRAGLEGLRDRGMGAITVLWSESSPMWTYTRDPGAMPSVLSPSGDALANAAFLLGTTNWLVAANVALGPWLHLQTESETFAAVPPGTELTVEGRIDDLFEKKGHHFVDVEVGIYLPDDAPAARVRLRCIYRMRAPQIGS